MARAPTKEFFGPFDVLERLGAGGMATVHRAIEHGPQGLRRVIALKRPHAHLAEDETFVRSFVREARLASLLQHPCIVRTYELARVGAAYFISMEYVPGRDLRVILGQASSLHLAAPAGVALALMIDLVDALDHAHTRCGPDGTPLGIVHCDISPSNLMVSRAGQLKVIDFGIARAGDSLLLKDTGHIRGKLPYMAPEALLGQFDARSDLFSACVIVHELLTAQRLFGGGDDADTIERLRTASVPRPSAFNSTCPPELDEILLRGLAADPAERWPSALALREALSGLERAGVLPATRGEVLRWVASVSGAGQAGGHLDEPALRRADGPIDEDHPTSELARSSGRATSHAHRVPLRAPSSLEAGSDHGSTEPPPGVGPGEAPSTLGLANTSITAGSGLSTDALGRVTGGWSHSRTLLAGVLTGAALSVGVAWLLAGGAKEPMSSHPSHPLEPVNGVEAAKVVESGPAADGGAPGAGLMSSSLAEAGREGAKPDDRVADAGSAAADARAVGASPSKSPARGTVSSRSPRLARQPARAVDAEADVDRGPGRGPAGRPVGPPGSSESPSGTGGEVRLGAAETAGRSRSLASDSPGGSPFPSVDPARPRPPASSSSVRGKPLAPPLPADATPASPRPILVVPASRMRRVDGEAAALRLPPGETAPPQIAARLCVDREGRVGTVDVLSKVSPAVRASIRRTLSRWRYRPVMEARQASAVCFARTFPLELR